MRRKSKKIRLYLAAAIFVFLVVVGLYVTLSSSGLLPLVLISASFILGSLIARLIASYDYKVDANRTRQEFLQSRTVAVEDPKEIEALLRAN